MYKSTRSKKLYTSSEAILNGLADDGGLFIPESINNIDFNESWLTHNYKQTSFKILKHFFDDFTDEEINYVINKAYSKNNFINKIYDIKNFDNHTYLELYHGPTLAFKDMALTMLPHLMDVAIKKNNYNHKITILTATSGDTGGAALNGFKDSKNINIVVLYPNNGVSEFQQKQMLSFTNKNAKAFAMDNNFDECQNIVKELFNNNNSDIILSSANSINIGRLVPQIIYYFQAYIDMVNTKQISFNDKINVCVPTGNFGNILAAFIAKMIGLPINEFICASNENNILTDFFNTGIYNINRPFYKTNTPSMDILISSNLERLLYLMTNDENEIISLMNSLKQNKKYTVSKELFDKLSCFKAYYATQNETINTIKDTYLNYGYLIDPHTSVARTCHIKHNSDIKTLIVSTASPLKFSETIIEALNLPQDYSPIYTISKYCDYKLDENIIKIINTNKQKIVLNKNEIKEYIFNKKYEITVPATTANLGCGFDVLGMALDITNKYRFYMSDTYKCIGFDPEFTNPDNNLIVQAYKYVFSQCDKEALPITVEQIERNVSSSGGLGTSAICIIAGMKIAGHLLNIKEFELVNHMINFEGHPDNILPAVYGGLISTFKDNDKYYYEKYSVNKDLKFIIYYPDFKVETKLARQALPKNLEYKDIIFNLSRIINIPKYFNNGNIKQLKMILKDKLHQPYRLPLIDKGDLIFNLVNEDSSSACVISGSGASLLVITTDLNIINKVSKLNLDNWQYIICKPYDKKVVIK